MMKFWSYNRKEADDSREALLSAALSVERATARDTLVTRLVSELKQEREMNNFVARLNMHVRREDHI